MLSLKLCNDRTEVDLDRLAQAFSIGRVELEDHLRLGTISYWYELGASDDDTPQMVFRSKETGRRVALDRVGNVLPNQDEGTLKASPRPENKMSGSADLLTSDVSKGRRPPRPSDAVSVEADRLVA
ncbi:DUF6522 family protein [uncultured Paracoccus sp.]|uniref:DUF6522 family protein n=1 Tax=uncultured Paracoccus sp. TaxID=189685 RepID=UPI0026249B75|nr:DUF6522 family protein [uncultured Paracoccus sp.]